IRDKLDVRDTMTETQIHKSNTAQIAQMDDDNEREREKDDSYMDDEHLPPTFVMRLNAHSSETSNRNWQNDREIVEDLFVEKNIKKIEEEKKNIEEKIESGEQTLEEMDQR